MGYGFHYFKGEHLDRATKVKIKVREIVDNLNWDDSKIDVTNNWIKTHLFTVSVLSQLLALKRGQNGEMALISGLLHDIGLVVNIGMEKSHAINGYDKAKEILEEVGDFTPEEIETIAGAAAHHSEKDKVDPNWLNELMKDVDVLDCALAGSDFSEFPHHYKRVKNLEKELGIKL